MEKEVSFFNIEAWSRLAESAANLGRKGRGVRVVGRLRQDRWNDTGGKPQSRVVIVAEHLEFRPEFKKDARGEADTEECETEEIPEEAETLVPTF
jgi:single-strand DNA-binding protein